jgi:hypothetical protein
MMPSALETVLRALTISLSALLEMKLSKAYVADIAWQYFGCTNGLDWNFSPLQCHFLALSFASESNY